MGSDRDSTAATEAAVATAVVARLVVISGAGPDVGADGGIEIMSGEGCLVVSAGNTCTLSSASVTDWGWGVVTVFNGVVDADAGVVDAGRFSADVGAEVCTAVGSVAAILAIAAMLTSQALPGWDVVAELEIQVALQILGGPGSDID